MTLSPVRFLAVTCCAVASLQSCSAPMMSADAGTDAGSEVATDAGPDAAVDAGLPDAGSIDAGFDAGIDAGPPLPRLDAGTLTWVTSATPSRLRNHHVGFIAETDAGVFLYAMGGIQGTTPMNNVDRYPIDPTGAVGAGIDTGTTPARTGGHAVAVLGQTVMIAGGMATGGVLNTSSYATVQPDGTLSAWKSAGSTVHGRMHGGAFAYGNDFYLLGGFKDPDVWNDVVRSTLQPDGGLTPWTSAGTLPTPRSHFSVSELDGYVFLTGGLDESAFGNPPTLDTVIRGHVDADAGVLGEWSSLTPLPGPLATHASFIWRGYLYVGGGINTSDHEAGMWRAHIERDYSLSAWEQVTSLPEARGHVHQFPQYKNHVYSVAGAIDFSLNSTSHIEVGSFE